MLKYIGNINELKKYGFKSHDRNLSFIKDYNYYWIELTYTGELGYIISKLDLLIGCEAGVTHFAGILNVPMIVLVGSSSPLVLRHYKDVRIVRKGSCHSCNRFIIPNLRDCRCGSLDDNPHSECLTKVTVEDLIEEIKIFKGTYFKKKYKINV